jgi:hypothetical protein
MKSACTVNSGTRTPEEVEAEYRDKPQTNAA